MILSIGEILVDIFVDKNNKEVFPGGAPFNVAVNIAHFGGKVSFLGSVGDDQHGKYLNNLTMDKIPNSYIKILKERSTSEAIVTLIDGERSFKFNREQGADYLLNLEDIKHFDLSKFSIVHFGTLMLSFEEGREFFFNAINFIKQNTDALVSIDINYRDDIFECKKDAKNVFLKALKYVDIVKLTSEELELLSGRKCIFEALDNIISKNQIAIITFGKDGSMYYKDDQYIKVPSKEVKPIDTTGAGDAFYSYFLYSYDLGIDLNNKNCIKNTLTRANAAGALATQKKGAVGVAPTNEEIDAFLSI